MSPYLAGRLAMWTRPSRDQSISGLKDHLYTPISTRCCSLLLSLSVFPVAMHKLLFLALVGTAAATTGFDAIQQMSSSTFTCLSQNGYSFFIARVWESVGNYDEIGIANIKNAKAAGWQFVDGYIFPCLRSGCATPEAQVEATVNRLHSEGAAFGMIWLDIEILAWPADQNANRNFITRMANQLNAMKINWGIYTNNNNWGQIVGISWNAFASRPLWWANYNGHQDYTNFVPFGGWTKPSIHQYAGDYKGPCGVDLDLNWYP